MELKKPQLVRNFWPRYRRKMIPLAIGFSLLTTAAAAGILWISGHAEDILTYGSVLGGIFVTSLTGLLVFGRIASKPLQALLTAVAHASGEPTPAPPRPSEKVYARNGLSAALEAIYALDTASAEKSDTPSADSSRGLVEDALDAALCGFVAFDQSRKITYANKATPIRVDTQGVMSLDLIFEEGNSLDDWWNECQEASVRAEKTWPRISNKLPNEEGRRFFDVIASYNKDARNEVVVTLVDRTQLYHVGEEELDFIAFAAHELRGPITVIRGYLDVLQDELKDVLADDQKELFYRLAVSANKLSGYINNILNTSRYDRRHLRMHLSETTVAAVYDTIRDDMALRASSQGRLLAVDIPKDLPTIAADTASLSEVMSNLIDNAIKYSNEGGSIAVRAALAGDQVEIAVEDHGIGMPGNVVGNLFQKFYRSHRSRETVAGTGIGLYISKAIVESHGGTISVRSEEGKGSTFTVSLPTYRSIADKLQTGDNTNQSVMKKTEEGAWIKNHSSYRG